MGQRVDTLTRACKCGCGKQFKLKRKDMLFYKGHKAAYNKLIYEAGKIAVKNAVQCGGNKMPTIQSVEEWARTNRKPSNKTETSVKNKKKWHPSKIEGSPRLQRLAKILKRGGSHSTLALQRINFVAVSTMMAELRWNFLERADLPEEYKEYKGMDVVSSTRRINKKTVWFYKLEKGVV